MLSRQDVTLNIRYDAPAEVWQKIPLIYEQMPGWLGFGEDQLPYWFSFNPEGFDKVVYASVEIGGLQICGNMENNEWEIWLNKFKEIASLLLGFEVCDGFA